MANAFITNLTQVKNTVRPHLVALVSIYFVCLLAFRLQNYPVSQYSAIGQDVLFVCFFSKLFNIMIVRKQNIPHRLKYKYLIFQGL